MTVQYGIIGYGRIGSRHAKMVEEQPHTRLVAACDIDETVKPPAGVPLYLDLDEFLQKARPEVVSVCTPNGLHAAHTIKALEAGAHVICEKPLALDADDARAMVAAAEANDRHLVCVLQNRYSPQTVWLKDVVEKGRLGEIYQVQVNCFWNRDDRYFKTPEGESHPWHGRLDLDGGPLYTQFSHFIDILVWLFGDLHVMNGMFHNYAHKGTIDFEDAGKFDFAFGNSSGSFHYSIAVWDKNQESSITIIGSKGSVRIAGQYMNELDYCHIEGYTPPTFNGSPEANNYGTYHGSASNHFYVIDDMVTALRNGHNPGFDIADAVTGVDIIERVYAERRL